MSYCTDSKKIIFHCHFFSSAEAVNDALIVGNDVRLSSCGTEPGTKLIIFLPQREQGIGKLFIEIERDAVRAVFFIIELRVNRYQGWQVCVVIYS